MKTKEEIIDIYNILEKTMIVVPTAWDMHHEKFNCGCHLELTNKTYEMIGERFNTNIDESKKIVDEYFKNTN